MSGAAGDEPHDVTTASVLRRDVPWETYLTARLLSEPDLRLIRGYDKRSQAKQEELLAEVRVTTTLCTWSVCKKFLPGLQH